MRSDDERTGPPQRLRQTGGLILMIAGVVGTAVGLGVLVLAARGHIVFSNSLWTVVSGFFVLVISLVEFVGGLSSYRGKPIAILGVWGWIIDRM